jgi:hypothetical protein
MARVTYVKKAQQRFYTKPVIDPETGQQKQTPVMKTVKEYVRDADGVIVKDENGKGKVVTSQVQKTTKTGRPVFLRVTEDDKTRPKPNSKCEACGKEIKVGDPYKHVTVKSSYGGTKHIRCADCPTWQPWDLSNSLSARLSQVSHDFEEAVQGASEPGDVEAALSDAAQAVRDIAEEKRESASNIEEGFGHSTSMSEELEQTAEALDSWADEIESADVPELPDAEPRYYITHNGEHLEADGIEAEGYETQEEAQADLDSYVADNSIEDSSDYDVAEEEQDDPSEDQIQEWRDECISSLSIVDESPV